MTMLDVLKPIKDINTIMKNAATLLFALSLLIPFILGGCQSSKEVNYGYGIEMEDDPEANKAKVID